MKSETGRVELSRPRTPKKEMNQLLGFLFLEILVGVNAGVTFSIVESRYFAALWTGFCFALLGLLLTFWSYRHKRKLLFAVAFVHTFIMSLPIWITRVANRNDLPLESVLGAPGPVMHKAASGVFWVLVAVTLFEAIRMFRAEMKNASL